MADEFNAQQPVRMNDGTDDYGFSTSKPYIVSIVDAGGDQIDIDASGYMSVNVQNTVTIQDGGGSITIDDGAGSITVDGTVAISGTVTVTATQLDIDDLDKASDSVAIWSNTVKDGSGTAYQPLVDADGHLQVDVLSGGDGYAKVDDSAFTVGTDEVVPMGALADDTATDSVDEGDVGIPRMTLDRKLLTRIVGATDANRLDVDASGHAQIDIAALSLTALPVSKDSSANSMTNPIYVQEVEGVSGGTVVCDYDQAASIAKAATDNHDYTITAATTLRQIRVTCSASLAARFEIQVGPVASLVTKKVVFTSASTPTKVVDLNVEVPDTSTGTVRVIRKNMDNKTQDLYSTIEGIES